MSDIQLGTFRVRGIKDSVEFGTANTGTKQVGVGIEFLDGPNQGRRMVWFSSFTDRTMDRTFESLRHLGWDSDDLTDMSGIGSTEAEAVIDEEEYEGKVRVRVKWINGARGPSFKNKMEGNDLRAFAASMKGKAIANRQKSGGGNGSSSRGHDGPPPHNDDDRPF